MRKLLFTSVAALALAASLPAYAQISKSPATDGQAVVGGTAGAAAGAGVGFVVGGPIGAIIGGFTGAVLGAEAAVPEQTIVYAGANPVEVVYVDSTWDVGATVPESITLYPVEPTPEYSYVYANNRVYIVKSDNREIVYSPGYVIPDPVVTYVEANPSASISFDGELSAGTQLEGSVNITTVPDYPQYGYVYLNDRPALVDMNSRTVIWVK